MTYWHEHNPWADEVVYLPNLEELSALLDPDHPNRYRTMWVEEHDDLVDAYILPLPSGWHSIGIRYGKEPEDYDNVYLNKYVIELLLHKYGGVKNDT